MYVENKQLQKKLSALEYKWLSGTITPEEEQEYMDWYNQEDGEPVIVPAALSRSEADHKRQLYKKIASGMKKQKRSPWLRAAAAAAVVSIVAAGSYLWLQNDREQIFINNQHLSADILPGKDGAILTLADGRQVVLDSMGNGVIAVQNGSQVMLRNGQVTYDLKGNASGKVSYNTMTIPKGRQFQLTLPDGTKVWLNSASSIRYPTVFTGKERSVEIRGEAYFEVAQNAKTPFRVKAGDHAEIEVLGTQFNVNAYDDEKTLNTTLLEGSIRVNDIIIKPGQQAQLTSSVKVINDVDIDKVMAWKNGLFNFEGATLKEVMRQLERWYDIEVVYEKNIPAITFGGKMTKGVSLSGLLIALERSEVHFRLEGRKLIVLP